MLRWFDFDSAPELGSTGYQGDGSNHGYVAGNDPTQRAPVIDTAVKCSGVGSMRFDLETLSGSDGAGLWGCSFHPLRNQQVGVLAEGSVLDRIYVQMRVRWNRVFTEAIFYAGAWTPMTYADVTSRLAMTPIDASSFSVVGDQTAAFTTNTFVTVYNALGDALCYAPVVGTPVYAGGVTTITVDTGPWAFGIGNLWSGVTVAGTNWLPITVVDDRTFTVPTDRFSTTYWYAGHRYVRISDDTGAHVCYARATGGVYSGGVTTVTIDTPTQGALPLSGTVYASTGNTQGGLKFFDIAPGYNYTNNSLFRSTLQSEGANVDLDYPGTSVAPKVVVQTYYQTRAPIGYYYGPGTSQNQGCYQSASGDYLLQNGYGPSYCSYNAVGALPGTAIIPGCWCMPPDEWVTFQLYVRVLGRNTTTNWNFEAKLWAAREGQGSQLLLDWNPSTPGYVPAGTHDMAAFFQLGNLWLFPYLTGKDVTQPHPTINGETTAKMWVDEVIISTQPIADPSFTTPSVYPAWRDGRTVGQMYYIDNTQNMSGLHFKTPGANDTSMVNAWIGFAADEGKWWSALPSGHATTAGFDWQNPVQVIDFSDDAPAWTTYEAGSDYSAVTLTERYTDGRPASRHTYYSVQHIPAGVMSDGLERVMVFRCWAAYAFSIGGYGGGPEVVGFKVAARQWEPNGTHQSYPLVTEHVPSVCKHPTTHDVYVGAGNYVHKWTASTGQWSVLASWQTQPTLSSWNDGAEGFGSLVDVIRNRVVCLNDGVGGPSPVGSVRLQWADLNSPHAVSKSDVSGPLAAFVRLETGSQILDLGFVHDTDRDLYIVVKGTTMYAIDPDTYVSTVIGTVDACAGGNDPLSRLAYLPDQGCIVYLAAYTSQIQFMPTR